MNKVSNVTAQIVELELQRGATTPQIGIRLKLESGAFLDWTTIHQLHLWVRNQVGNIVLKLSIDAGLVVRTPDGGAVNTLLVLEDTVMLPSSPSYSYDARLYLTESENFFPFKGPLRVVEYISE